MRCLDHDMSRQDPLLINRPTRSEYMYVDQSADGPVVTTATGRSTAYQSDLDDGRLLL